MPGEVPVEAPAVEWPAALPLLAAAGACWGSSSEGCDPVMGFRVRR